MKARFFKKGLVFRVLVSIIITSFIFTSGPVNVYCSSVVASDSLRPSAARGTGRERGIVDDLRNLGTGVDGVSTGDLIERLVVRFTEIGREDLAIAGGKGANLGELQKVEGVDVPPGVAVTTKGFELHIDKGTTDVTGTELTLREYISQRLEGLDYNDTIELAKAGEDIRNAVESAKMPQEVEDAIRIWYQQLSNEVGVEDLPVAVRSSATAEDLPDASFAGQQDTYLNMRGIEEVLDAVKRDWASLFTDRAIFYRNEQNIDHATAYVCVVIQQMVESEIAGTAFSVHPDTGFPAPTIDAAFGLGEGVVSGEVAPDSYVVSKDRNGKYQPHRRTVGSKLKKVVYRKDKAIAAKEGIEVVDTTDRERHSFSLTNRQVIQLSEAVEAIHQHYNTYMDIEWAFDGKGRLWILQARPETVWNQWERENPDTVKQENTVVPEKVAQAAEVLLTGTPAKRAASGKVVIVDATKTGGELAKELDQVKQGDILVTTMTRPDMVPAMKRAAAIVTDEGGPTCHAAIVARELGIPCVVGTGKATKVLKEGMEITVDANRGKVYAGRLQIQEITDNVHIPDLPVTKTKIGTIVSSPVVAMDEWRFSTFPSHNGIGLMRKEFTDTTEILIHPLAGLDYDRYYRDPNLDEEQRQWIKENIIDNEELRTAIKVTSLAIRALHNL